MKKLLLLSIVLIVGCDYAPTEHTHEHVDNSNEGICVRSPNVDHNISADHHDFYCYENKTTFWCMKLHQDNSNQEWFENMTCTQFCENVPDSMDFHVGSNTETFEVGCYNVD